MPEPAQLHRFLRRGSVAAAILLCSVAGQVAGSAAGRPAAQISVQVNVVTVPVTVTDRKGTFVGGLKRRNFRLLVDGAEQPIEYFDAEVQPAQVLLLIETGPAVYLLGPEHVAAAMTLLEGLAPGDRVAVASYSESPHLIAGFTADKQQAASALGEIHYGLGMAQLNFYDSLASVVRWLGTGSGKRSVVVLTTGLDSSGPRNWERLTRTLQQSNVMVLPVALGGKLRDVGRGKSSRSGADQPPEGLSFATSDRALKAIAADSGGYAYFPRSGRDFEQDYRKIAALMRHEYSLGFNAGEHDGRYHVIRVELVNDQGQPFDGKDRRRLYRTNARRGFLAPQP